jgi:hypothetical protein
MTSGSKAKAARRHASPAEPAPPALAAAKPADQVISEGAYTLYELPDGRWLLCVLLKGETEDKTRRIPIPSAGAVALRAILNGQTPNMQTVMAGMRASRAQRRQ